MQQNQYMTIQQAAKKWGVSRQLVSRWLNDPDGPRVGGAVPIHGPDGSLLQWQIPVDASRPENRRPGPKPQETA